MRTEPGHEQTPAEDITKLVILQSLSAALALKEPHLDHRSPQRSDLAGGSVFKKKQQLQI